MSHNKLDSHHSHHGDANDASSGGGRKIEKEKWALLGLALLVAGAIVLGVLTHAKSLEVRNAMKDIKIMINDGMDESEAP